MNIRMVVNSAAAMAVALAVIASPTTTSAAPGNKTPKILEFDTMVGLPGTFTGTQSPIRGVNGGGLPWSIGSAKGELDVYGRLEIRVRGLVLAAGSNTGINPLTTFRAVVSCLAGDHSAQNVTTLPFPASSAGDADIEAVVALPQPCIAPIVFVTTAGGAWIAATGN